MTEAADDPAGPNAVARVLREARELLDAIELPKEQRNDRSALVLLALLGMNADSRWSEADSPLLGVTEIMGRIRDDFGKDYAPNTRETIRRFTLHQFVIAGMVLHNPDAPDRPVNSPRTRYRAHPRLVSLARTAGSDAWAEAISDYRKSTSRVASLQSTRREMRRIPLKLPDGSTVKLTPGGQNKLVKRVLEDFFPRFVPDGVLLYLGDAGNKWLHCETSELERMGVVLDDHGKAPDLIVHRPGPDWLVLVEAVTSHGPINPKRRLELKRLFASARPGLVFVTAFLDRKAMTKHLAEIAWETEVWIAAEPDHVIHFNGERFLGPYEGESPGHPPVS